MGKLEIIDTLVNEGNGYPLTARVTESGISKTTLAEYVKRRNMKRVAQGIYFSENAWPDALYLIYLRNQKIFYSQDTALYLHGLVEREPGQVTVTVKAGYNAGHLREKGIKVYQVRAEQYELGASKITTRFGNQVAIYDKERTICDIIKNKENMEVQTFRTAMKTYMGSADKNIPNLMTYAVRLNVEEKVKTYMEVML